MSCDCSRSCQGRRRHATWQSRSLQYRKSNRCRTDPAAVAVGKIKEVIIWENKRLSWWPKNTELRTKADTLPKGLHWDLWLGVREARPYLAQTYHPKNWRAWFDFGVGEMGDMGCHHFDPTFDALKLTAPLRVRQTTEGSEGPLWGKTSTSGTHFSRKRRHRRRHGQGYLA